MPWQPQDALSHTRKARTPAAQKQWSAVGNAVLARGGSDASAIRQANAVIRNRFGKSSEGEAKPSPKRLGPTKGIGGRSRSSASETETEELKRPKKVRRPDTKRLFRTEVDRRSMKVRMRGR